MTPIARTPHLSRSSTPHVTGPDPTDRSAGATRGRRGAGALGGAAALALVLAGCGSGGAPPAGGGTSPTGGAPAGSAAPTEAVTPAPPAEVASARPRLVLTHEGGLTVLDGTTLEEVASFELEGYHRINDAGDGRHVLVTALGGFRVLDVGVHAAPHGDHDHYYAGAPVLTDAVWPATTPAHVVAHDGRTALFDDGTGDVVVLDSADVADPGAAVRTFPTGEAHHGVAVERADGHLLVTEGTEDARSTVRVVDADGDEVVRTEDCPGVHGEASAADGVVVVGCEDGVVVWSGDELTKVSSPDPFGRIGNQAGSEASSVVLGDYRSDPDAEQEVTTRVSLTDTATGTLRLVGLPAAYTFRSLARGDDGEALVLGTDGALHVLDPGSGELLRSVPVVDAWEPPARWQEPRPTVRAHAGTAYVSDPVADAVHAVDVETGEVFASVELDVTPDELVPVSGDVVRGVSRGHGDDRHDGDHDHDQDHDHDHAAEGGGGT